MVEENKISKAVSKIYTDYSTILGVEPKGANTSSILTKTNLLINNFKEKVKAEKDSDKIRVICDNVTELEKVKEEVEKIKVMENNMESEAMKNAEVEINKDEAIKALEANKKTQEDSLNTKEASLKTLLGLEGAKFGIAVGSTYIAYGGNEADEFQIITITDNSTDPVTESKTVVIKKRREHKINLMLETHYLFVPNHSFLWLVEKQYWGVGPFLTIAPSSDGSLINMYGLGLMFGFKRVDSVIDSWNIGFGMVLDNNINQLAEGIKLNEPLPAGIDGPYYSETSKWGTVLLVSFTF